MERRWISKTYFKKSIFSIVYLPSSGELLSRIDGLISGDLWLFLCIF